MFFLEFWCCWNIEKNLSLMFQQFINLVHNYLVEVIGKTNKCWWFFPSPPCQQNSKQLILNDLICIREFEMGAPLPSQQPPGWAASSPHPLCIVCSISSTVLQVVVKYWRKTHKFLFLWESEREGLDAKIVSLRTSNRKKSREFSQKRFIGTQLMHEVHLHQVEGANATEICANEPSAIAGQ